MRLNYLALLESIGFVIPVDKSCYDERLMVMSVDNRRKEILTIIDYALRDFWLVKNTSEYLLFLYNDCCYKIWVDDNTLKCRGYEKIRNFDLMIDKDGKIIFKREYWCLEGMLDIKYEYFNHGVMYISGYDKYSLDYLDECNLLLPDFKRKISLLSKSYYEKVIEEYDLIFECTASKMVIDNLRYPEFILLESFFKQMDYQKFFNDFRKYGLVDLDLHQR